MGILEFIDDLFMSNEEKYLIISAIERYKINHPDVNVFQEQDCKPCEYYFHYEDDKGNRYVDFYRSYPTARERWEEEKIIQRLKNGKVFSLTVMSYTYNPVGRCVGIDHPWSQKGKN